MKTSNPAHAISAVLALCLTFASLPGYVQAQTPSATPQSTAQQLRPSQWAKPVNTAINLYQIDTWLYRSQQPQASNVAQLKALGIRTVISFRAFHSDDTIIQDPDIALIRIPIHTSRIRDPQVIAALRAIEQAHQRGAVLIHCMHGADRTGLISAMYRVIYQGWSKEAALDEMRNGGFGFHTMWTNIPKYLEQVDVPRLTEQLR